MAQKLSRKEKRQLRKNAKQIGDFQGKIKCPALDQYWHIFDEHLKELGEEYELSKRQVGKIIKECHRRMRKIVISAQNKLRQINNNLEPDSIFRFCFKKFRSVLNDTEQKMALVA